MGICASPHDVRDQLRSAISELNLRCLTKSAYWVSQLLVYFDDLGETSLELSVEGGEIVKSGWLSAEESDAYQYARSLFALREYARCADVLQMFSSGLSGEGLGLENLSPVSRFLTRYALFLAGKAAIEAKIVAEGSKVRGNSGAVENPEARAILESLQAQRDSSTIDGFELYLLSSAQREVGDMEGAYHTALAAVEALPWNWGAWDLLVRLCANRGKLEALILPGHFFSDIFRLSLNIEQQQINNAFRILERSKVLHYFRKAPAIIGMEAAASYNIRDFDAAQRSFDAIEKEEAHCLDNLDLYSNVLYIGNMRSKLGRLAHRVYATDRYRPESCCIVGNYYSLVGQHEIAVKYFLRALALDRTFLRAWTLIGHEYLELKNIPEAIKSYREAVNANPREYRALYGLGQAYEVMFLPHYALFYFRKAAELRANDPTMWIVLADCYKSLQRNADAVRCLQHADACSSARDPTALLRLAELCRSADAISHAVMYYKQLLHRVDNDDYVISDDDMCTALFCLAQAHVDAGEWEDAEKYCSRLMKFGGNSQVSAVALMKEVRKHVADETVAGHSPIPKRVASLEPPGSGPDIFATPQFPRGGDRANQSFLPMSGGSGSSRDMDMSMDQS